LFLVGVVQFETNTYQAGGIALSPDERTLYFTATHAVRRVDLETGAASTVAPPELAGFAVRGLAVGASGVLYLTGWGATFFAIHPDGTVETRPLDATQAWGGNGGGPPGYIGVDEARGWIYGMERNLKSGALYRWPVAGGAVEWLNHAATGTRDPIQYLSDGPVANLDMANPGALTVDAQGYVYLGAGDGCTFRRYQPDTQIVESLCAVVGSAPEDHLVEWCIGDGVRNQLFGTWPSFLTFDAAGNGYFGYTVWPRLIRLRREG
jgi:hypothetical protein